MKYELRVYYEDTDAGGVVYYANYMKFAERARTEWLRSLGYEQRSLWQTHGIGFMVKACHCDYHAPAFLDDALQVVTGLTSHTRTTLTMQQKIFRDALLLTTLTVVLVCVNANLKPERLPDDVKHALR